MKVDNTLKNYKVGDFVLVLPYGMIPWEKEFNKIRDDYYANNYDLDEKIQVGVVKGISWSKHDNEILMKVKLAQCPLGEDGVQFYNLERIIPFDRL